MPPEQRHFNGDKRYGLSEAAKHDEEHDREGMP